MSIEVSNSANTVCVCVPIYVYMYILELKNEVNEWQVVETKLLPLGMTVYR